MKQNVRLLEGSQGENDDKGEIFMSSAEQDVVLFDSVTPEGELGLLKPLICNKCDFVVDAFVSRTKPTPVDGFFGNCPVEGCAGKLEWYIGGIQVTITVRGPGVSSTKYGQRRARELTKRNEVLAKKQWDQVEVPPLSEGRKARNPTLGGPLDPNGPFVKKQKDKTIFTSTSTTEIKSSGKQ